jgi:hypothetical protein
MRLATRLRHRPIVGGMLIMLLLIILDTFHIVHWPVNARYVVAYPWLFRNRPLYIYDAAPPGINYGIDECSLPAGLGDSWSAISTGISSTMPVRTARFAPVTASFFGRLALYGVVKQAPSMYPGVCSPMIFYIDATAMWVMDPPDTDTLPAPDTPYP